MSIFQAWRGLPWCQSNWELPKNGATNSSLPRAGRAPGVHEVACKDHIYGSWDSGASTLTPRATLAGWCWWVVVFHGAAASKLPIFLKYPQPMFLEITPIKLIGALSWTWVKPPFGWCPSSDEGRCIHVARKAYEATTICPVTSLWRHFSKDPFVNF